jgi:2,4-dienoyl-CoA reductase (NADPH2)
MSAAAGSDRYPHVFSGVQVGPLEFGNRMYMAPHGIPLQAPMPGHEAFAVPSAETPAYYAERAAAGVELIFHSTQVGPIAAQTNLSFNPGLPEAVPSYRAVADAIHAEGAKVIAEVWYAGFFPKRWEPLGPEAPVLGPSGTQMFALPVVLKEMNKAEIAGMVEQHAIAARNLREAGYDGIEIHASHSCIVEYFLSPSFNHRTDEYGCDFDGRFRFLRECIEAVKAEIGGEMALGVRLNADEIVDGGYGQEDARSILVALDGLGTVDFVDIDVSIEPDQMHLMTTPFFERKLHNADRVSAVKDAAGAMKVLATPGRLTEVAEAEALLEQGLADMVGAVRGLIAEPELLRKALEGREHEGRTCIAANHCIESGAVNGFGCAINPEAGREVRWGRLHRDPAPRSTEVTVVGGGPAGLEAARVAALRGHSVTLLEARERLGGGVAVWGSLPGREHVATAIGWYADRLADLGVEVRTGVEATVEEVAALEPEVAILATGSRYSAAGRNGFTRRPIPGWEGDGVLVPEDVLLGGRELRGKVVIVEEEGLHAAAGIAEIAAANGAEVEIVTRYPTVGNGLQLNMQLGYTMGRLATAGVVVTPLTFVREIAPGSVTVYGVVSGAERRIDGVDAVVLATQREALNPLAELEGRVDYVYTIGDALAPRMLREATYEGYKFGRLIGEEGMPANVSEELFRPTTQALRPAGRLENVL